jgi:hypothetical protein
MYIKLKLNYLKENVHGGGAGEGGSGDKDGGDEKNLDEMEEGEEAELNEEELGEGEEDDDEDDLDDEELQGNIPDYDPAIDGHCCTLCGAVFSAKKRLVQHLKVCSGFLTKISYGYFIIIIILIYRKITTLDSNEAVVLSTHQ